jgi:hypothetical protein
MDHNSGAIVYSYATTFFQIRVEDRILSIRLLLAASAV